MKCIVGLGNPGSRYRYTRHNIGFLAMEYFIDSFGAKHFESTELFECYHSTMDSDPLLLMMPQTYMNNSGTGVRELLQRHELRMEDLLVIYDDFQLPLGTLRMRPKGSDGGHNGMASIIYHLQSDLIPRLRIGVGGKSIPGEHTHELMAEYVLSPFDAEEQKLLASLFLHARTACESWMRNGIQQTMSRFNKNFFNSVSSE